jgi:hypothetical protein
MTAFFKNADGEICWISWKLAKNIEIELFSKIEYYVNIVCQKNQFDVLSLS